MGNRELHEITSWKHMRTLFKLSRHALRDLTIIFLSNVYNLLGFYWASLTLLLALPQVESFKHKRNWLIHWLIQSRFWDFEILKFGFQLRFFNLNASPWSDVAPLHEPTINIVHFSFFLRHVHWAVWHSMEQYRSTSHRTHCLKLGFVALQASAPSAHHTPSYTYRAMW